MNKLELLYEELKDMAKNSDLVHYTNYYGLVGILESGILKGQNYVDKSRDDTTEVAGLRISKDNYLQAMKKKDSKKFVGEMDRLTQNAGFVKIFLHTNRIRSGVRGARQKPVAELYKYSARNFNEICNEVTNLSDKPLTVERVKKIVKKRLEELKNKIGLEELKSYEFKAFNEIALSISEYLNNKIENADLHNKYINKWAEALDQGRYIHYPSTMGREAEERFSFKYEKEKTSGIPVNPLYMEIVITTPSAMRWIFDDIKDINKFLNEFIELRDNIDKYNNVFRNDDNFKKFKFELNYVIENKKMPIVKAVKVEPEKRKKIKWRIK